MSRPGGNFNSSAPHMQPSMQMGGNPGAKKGKSNFLDPNDVSMLSIPRQTKIYISKLHTEAAQKGGSIFEYQELVRIGKEINL